MNDYPLDNMLMNCSDGHTGVQCWLENGWNDEYYIVEVRYNFPTKKGETIAHYTKKMYDLGDREIVVSLIADYMSDNPKYHRKPKVDVKNNTFHVFPLYSD